MHHLLLIYALILALSHKPSENCRVGENLSKTLEDTIYWSKDYQLTRDDFQAKVPKNTPYAGYSYTIILFEYEVESLNAGSIKPNFTIKAAFNKSRSWISPSSIASPDRVLKHEQLHFDITELAARRLRKRLEKKRFGSDFRKEINRIYNDEMKKAEFMQNSYDKETDHGLIEEKQIHWELKIKNLIEIE